MTTPPKLSIIIPIYNVEKYLPTCIESFLSQTYTDFELLLIDDGSPDSCGQICDEYAAKDSRIRVFHKENEGVSRARNLGLDNARGEIISFVDADDWVTPSYCDTIVSNMENKDFLLFSETWYYEDGCVAFYSAGEREAVGRENVEEGLAFLMCNNTLKHGFFCLNCYKAFLRSIIEEHHIRYKESIYIKEDEILIYEYCQYIESFKYVEANMYYYRKRNESLSHRKWAADQCLLFYENLSQLVSCYSNPKFILCIKKEISSALFQALLASPSLRQKAKVISLLRKHFKDKQVRYSFKEIIIKVLGKLIKYLEKK